MMSSVQDRTGRIPPASIARNANNVNFVGGTYDFVSAENMYCNTGESAKSWEQPSTSSEIVTELKSSQPQSKALLKTYNSMTKNICSDEENWKGIYDLITAENLYYNTGECASKEEPCSKSESNPDTTYSKLKHNEQVTTKQIETHQKMKNVSPRRNVIRSAQEIILKDAKHTKLFLCLAACFVALIITTLSVLVGFVAAFVMIANLHSKITAMELSKSTLALDLEVNGDLLRNLSFDLACFEYQFQLSLNKTKEWMDIHRDNSSVRISDLYSIGESVNYSADMILDKVKHLACNLLFQLDNVSAKIVFQWNESFERIAEEIVESNCDAAKSVKSLENRLIHDIQALNVFDSCNAIISLSLPFPPGIYWVKSSNESSIPIYCSSSGVPMSCNGKTSGWRRIAYLDTSESGPVQCPSELEENMDPHSCRRRDTGPGCTSVSIPIGNISYSCVYGRVNGLQLGTLDGFFTPGRTPTLEGNYVDGVSLTYGSPKQHVWSFAAAGSTPPSCMACDINLPEFISENFSCESTRSCPQASDCADQLLWSGGPQQCIGNSTFYRELSEPTSEDIEMRVCRDEDRSKEDILITFVEIFVL